MSLLFFTTVSELTSLTYADVGKYYLVFKFKV